MTDKQRPEPEIKKAALTLYLLAVVPAYAWMGYSVAFSVALGGALALVNLALLERWLARLISPMADPAAARGLVLFSFFLRMVATGAVILFFHTRSMVSFPALVIGLSIPLVAITTYFMMVRPIKDWYERAY
ncbi:MAG: ATP synthase subunit I [Nitrospinota bacterium]|nr:ATP synthase subunit I [Nitrospinota bacterium]MDH5679041.1 ATP synthase subunit I [Nitrospinota bacterium]MDH5755633.1 ATP synthase subunit I [Nitrospinota bacterium]